MYLSLLLCLFASLFHVIDGFYNDVIEVWLCKRPLSGTAWISNDRVNQLHHEIWLRDLETGDTTLISFAPSGIYVRHKGSDATVDERCNWSYKGQTNLAKLKLLHGHLDHYRKSYVLWRNNCQHFAHEALGALGLQ